MIHNAILQVWSILVTICILVLGNNVQTMLERLYADRKGLKDAEGDQHYQAATKDQKKVDKNILLKIKKNGSCLRYTMSFCRHGPSFSLSVCWSWATMGSQHWSGCVLIGSGLKKYQDATKDQKGWQLFIKHNTIL